MGMLIAGACALLVRNGHGCAQAGDATGGGAKAAWARWPARPADSMRGGEQQPPPGWARRSGAVGLPRPSTSAVRIPSRLSRSSRVRRDEAPRDSREEPEATRSPSFRIACGGAKCTRKVSLMLSLLLARSLRGWESRGLGSGAAGSLSGGAIGGAGGGTDIDCCLRRVASLAASMKAWGRPCSSLLSATAGCCCAGSLVVAAAAAAPCGDDGAVAAAALLRWLSPLTRPQRKRLARTRSSEQTAMTAAALSMVSHGSASSRSTDTKLPSSSEAAWGDVGTSGGGVGAGCQGAGGGEDSQKPVDDAAATRRMPMSASIESAEAEYPTRLSATLERGAQEAKDTVVDGMRLVGRPHLQFHQRLFVTVGHAGTLARCTGWVRSSLMECSWVMAGAHRFEAAGAEAVSIWVEKE